MNESKPKISCLRVFGSQAWHHIPKDNRRKLDSKFEEGIVIGCYDNSQYKLWIPSRNVAVLSRDVKFSESALPGENITDWIEDDGDRIMDAFDGPVPHTPEPGAAIPEGATTSTRQPGNSSQNINASMEEKVASAPSTDAVTHYPQDDNEIENMSELIEEEPESDDEMGDPSPENSAENDNSPESGNRRYPSHQRTQTQFYSPGSAKRAEAIIDDPHPETVQEALLIPDAEKWREAIDSELNSINLHSTWVPAHLPNGKNPFQLDLYSRENSMTLGG